MIIDGRNGGAADDRRARRRIKAGAGQIDTLTLTAEEHGVDSAARKLAVQMEARSARRQAEEARRYYRERAEIGPAPVPPRRHAPHAVESDPSFAHLSREEEAVARLRQIAQSLTSEPAARDDFRGDARGYRRGEHGRMNANLDPRGQDWTGAEAPSREDIEALAAAAYAALPQSFRDLCQGVAILVRDFAEDEVLEALGIENEYDLMGLYEGVELTHASSFDTPQDLNRIFLYRRPLLDYWIEHQETLGAVITHVLVHEIGHHFGLSDDDMEAIERAAG